MTIRNSGQFQSNYCSEGPPPLNPIVKLSDKTQSCNKYTLCIHEMFTLDILS